MNNNWKKYKLGDLCNDISYGYTESAAWDKIGPKFLRITDIQSDFINWETVPYCKISEKDLSKYQLSIGDIVIARTGNSTGSNAIIKEQIEAVYASYLIKYSLNKEIAFPFYIGHILRSQIWKGFVQSIIGGSAQPGANAKQFADFEITLPPLPEQQAIAEILSSLDDKIELNLQTNKTLEEMANTLYKHWFVDFGPFKNGKFIESELGLIPEGWEVKELKDVAEFINGYAFKSSDLLDFGNENCYSVFKMGNIMKGGGLKADGTKSYVSKSSFEESSKYILKKWDILMSMTDMKDKVTILGHTAMMNEDNVFVVNQRVGLIRLNNNIAVSAPFIYIVTNSSSFINELRSKANSGVQVNLSTEAIKNSKFISATKDINESFNHIVEPLFDKVFASMKENENLKQTRDYLLPKLISGQIRVKDAQKLAKEAL